MVTKLTKAVMAGLRPYGLFFRTSSRMYHQGTGMLRESRGCNDDLRSRTLCSIRCKDKFCDSPEKRIQRTNVRAITANEILNIK